MGLTAAVDAEGPIAGGAFSFVMDDATSVVATAIHAGHEVRPEISELLEADGWRHAPEPDEDKPPR